LQLAAIPAYRAPATSGVPVQVNAAKPDAADALGTFAAGAGMTLVQMATAFVTGRH
jgi:hypothetical protein